MNSSMKLLVDRLTDEVVAAEVAAGRFPAGDDLREIKIRMESAVHLAALAWHDPRTVFVVGCAREIELGSDVGGYIVWPRETRTIAKLEERVTLIAADGVSREEALIRLDHIWVHLIALPRGTVLATDEPCLNRPTNVLARLDTARAIVLQDIEAGTDLS